MHSLYAICGLAGAIRLCSASIVPANSTGDASWSYQTYKTVNFTPPVVEITHHTKPSEGYLFFAPDGATEFQLAPLIMDMYSELVWNGPVHEHAFSFGVQEYIGEPVLVWWNGSLYPEPIGRGNGEVYMYNNHYEQIHKVTLPGDFLEQVPNATYSSNIDVHEIFVTKNGTVVVTANNVTQADLTSVGGPVDGWVVAGLVYEIDVATNEVLFSWSTLDHLDRLPFIDSVYPLGSDGETGANQSLAWGYFHINAASPYDGGYIISTRFFCSAIAIDASGDVKWVLQGRDGGDFTLGNGTDFCYQHDIRAFPMHPPGNASHVTLHMHDNHNSPIDNGTVPSSGKSLNVDLVSKQVTLNQQYLNTSGPIYSTAQGNYQPLPDGNVFIGHGWIPVAEEFAQSGEILTTIQYGVAEHRPGGGFLSPLKPTLSYRTFKQHWVSCPNTRPDVVAEPSSNGTTVYISWNGATEVEAWSVYAGNTTDLTFVRTVPRIGFETVAEIASACYVQVVPRLRRPGHGKTGCGTNTRSNVVAVSG